MNYNSLMNKPTINYRELIGDNTVTEVGGITEEQFNTLLNTDLSSYYTKTQIDDLFSRSYVYREKSGSIVTFECPASVNGIDKVVSEIVAVQDLHGYDNPWVGGAGKNKANIADANVQSQTTMGRLTLPSGTYVASATVKNNTSIGGAIKINTSSETLVLGEIPSASGTSRVSTASFTLSESTEIVIVVSGALSGYNYDVSQVQIEKGTTATSYAPYSNICPISGWSAVNVYDGPTTDPQDATVYTTALKDENDQPLVCYGGELSNENGVQTLTVTHGYIASYNGETLPSTWISDRDVYAEGTTPTTGAEVVYALATSQQITQDTLSITSIAGINSIWCDSGDITVKALDRIIQG